MVRNNVLVKKKSEKGIYGNKWLEKVLMEKKMFRKKYI
jgi:hypothetical protein